MKQSQLFRRLILSIFLMLAVTAFSYSQNDAIHSVQEADTISPASKVPHHTLFMGTGYGTNMIYLGSTISGNQPYLYSALTYGFKSEFYATASAIHLSNVAPFLAFYIGSINYNHVFNSWFDISAGVYRYEVAKALPDTLFSSFTYGDFTLGIDWRLIYTRLSTGLLLSEENLSYFQIRNSRYFQTPEFLRKKVNFSFDPYINLLLGTLYKSETTTETFITTSSTTQMWRGANQGNLNTTKTSNTTAVPVTTTSTNTAFAKSFRLMEVDFGLPVALNSDRFTIEAEASYVLPLYDDSYFPGPKGFVLMFSCIFRIF
jgi:hypothetical protein